MLAGGVVGGLIGPQATRFTRDLFATPFQGSFVMLALVRARRARRPVAGARAAAVARRAHRQRPAAVAKSSRQPAFIVAALAGALGYGLMNLLMTATPIAMDFCGHPFSAAAWVIEWHVVAMYAPGFVTGSLIRRFGKLPVILAGVGADGDRASSSRSTAISVAHFVAALALVGVGWNFMYTGGTTLLTETYAPEREGAHAGR